MHFICSFGLSIHFLPWRLQLTVTLFTLDRLHRSPLYRNSTSGSYWLFALAVLAGRYRTKGFVRTIAQQYDRLYKAPISPYILPCRDRRLRLMYLQAERRASASPSPYILLAASLPETLNKTRRPGTLRTCASIPSCKRAPFYAISDSALAETAHLL